MASASDRTVALLSIRPRYAQEILNGSKRVEFRRTRFCRQISHVVIYCTFPVMRVAGMFEVERIESAKPERLWATYRSVAGIQRDAFQAYYRGAEIGIAIVIGRVWVLPCALRLHTLGRRVVPPQAYRYLDHSTIELLHKRGAREAVVKRTNTESRSRGAQQAAAATSKGSATARSTH